MKKLLFVVSPLFFYHSIFADNYVQNPSQNYNDFTMSQPSANRFFTVNLKCKTPLSVGFFQSCHLDILGLKHFKTGEKLEKLLVSIDGGMPEHAHGLPTSPKLTWIKEKTTYDMQGLKFNMPGKWQLSFYIEDEKHKLKDIVTFKLVL